MSARSNSRCQIDEENRMEPGQLVERLLVKVDFTNPKQPPSSRKRNAVETSLKASAVGDTTTAAQTRFEELSNWSNA